MGIKNQELFKKEIESLEKDLGDLENYIEDLSVFLPLPVCLINPLEFITDVNRAFEDLTGFKRLEAIGKSLEDFFLEKNKLKGILNKIKQQKIIRDEEFRLLSKTKEQIPVRVSFAGRKDRESSIYIGAFVAIVNIKELKEYQKNLEEEVKERTKELQLRIEELEKFHKLTVGRELKMIELKEEIRRLQKELEKKS